MRLDMAEKSKGDCTRFVSPFSLNFLDTFKIYFDNFFSIYHWFMRYYMVAIHLSPHVYIFFLAASSHLCCVGIFLFSCRL